MTPVAKSTLDVAEIAQFHERTMADLSAAGGFICAYLGDRLGLYKAMVASGPVTSDELAKLTNTSERYIREWLINQAAGAYLEYDPASKRYSLSPEHAVVLADESSEFFSGGAFQSFTAILLAAPRILDCMRSGDGLAWGDQHPDLFEGTERFFKPAYISQLVPTWIPAIDGLREKLESGAVVADVGCGHGVSTFVMARAFPKSRFYGYDNHLPSIERAQAESEKAGLSDRVSFHQVASNALPDRQYDLITLFDCLHDMGDPVAACRSAKETLKTDGCMMIIEPMAGTTVEENFNPVGRSYSAASVLCCTPNALASGGTALGTVATDEALRAVLKAGGFNNFRRAIATPFNRVFEARID